MILGRISRWHVLVPGFVFVWLVAEIQDPWPRSTLQEASPDWVAAIFLFCGVALFIANAPEGRFDREKIITDCPEACGPPTTIYNRFVRWARRGIWENLFRELAGNGRSADTQMIDSTHVKAHRSAAGGKGGAEAGCWPLARRACALKQLLVCKTTSIVDNDDRRGVDPAKLLQQLATQDGRLVCSTLSGTVPAQLDLANLLPLTRSPLPPLRYQLFRPPGIQRHFAELCLSILGSAKSVRYARNAVTNSLLATAARCVVLS